MCQSRGLKLHLDGARIFNVLVETRESPVEVGKYFDTISICISKGLGAPVGSLLIGSQNDIKKARKVRKVLGGGMRQAGYLAAACSYALDHHIEDLKIDNIRAKEIGELLKTQHYVESTKPVHTNIVIFKLMGNSNAQDFIGVLEEKGITAAPFGPSEVRFVFHRDLTDENMDELKMKLKGLQVT